MQLALLLQHADDVGVVHEDVVFAVAGFAVEFVGDQQGAEEVVVAEGVILVGFEVA